MRWRKVRDLRLTNCAPLSPTPPTRLIPIMMEFTKNMTKN